MSVLFGYVRRSFCKPRFVVPFCRVQRLQESLKAAQTERQALHQSERRLIEERRKRSALDSQLQAEQKQRRTIEERAAK